MAKAITGVRVARANRQAVTTTAETHVFDFGLTANLAVRIFMVIFAARWSLLPSTTFRSINAEFALHVEAGALENSLVTTIATENEDNLDSERIAVSILHATGLDEGTGGGAGGESWGPDPRHDFTQMPGGGLLIAINPTFRVLTANTVLTIDAGECAIWYRYEQLSRSELGGLLARRR